MSLEFSPVSKDLGFLWQFVLYATPKLFELIWKITQALTPIVSAVTAIIALHISRVNAKNTAWNAEAKTLQDARAVAFAVSPSVVKIMTDCLRLRRRLFEIAEDHEDKVGQSVAGSILALTIEMPPLLDRYLERLGALPDDVGRDCFALVSMLLSFNETMTSGANWIGCQDRGGWHGKVRDFLDMLTNLEKHADDTLVALEEVMATPPPSH